MSDDLLKKIILFSLLFLGIGGALAGITIIILKLNAHPVKTDYLTAGVMIVMGVFLIILRSILIKRKIMD